MNRKTFINRSLLTIGGLSLIPKLKAYPHASAESLGSRSGAIRAGGIRPMVISTWPHGMAANEAAWEVLAMGGRALDAVETGVRISELDPKVSSVGYGGTPDRDGIVSLDACIMNEEGDCGAVTFLQHIKNPISINFLKI